MIQRLFNPLKGKSFFLFGPRNSGKSTFLRSHFDPKSTLYLDFLDLTLQDELFLDPSRFESWVIQAKNAKTIIVDEIQKFPRVLDSVHRLIERDKSKVFVLTGSSARRIKQQGVNLLAGRALDYQFFPFSSLELGDSFDLEKALMWGGLPEPYLANQDSYSIEFLRSYVLNYIEKEIQQEQWVRKMEPFRRFLSIAGQMNGEIVNRSAIAREAKVDDVTVSNYYEILEDTLLGFYLPAYSKSLRKSQKQAPKFYFFDTGVRRAIDRSLTSKLLPQTYEYGRAFEHWVLLELKKYSSLKRLDWKFSYIRTKDDVEIDLIIDRPGQPKLLIEIKSKSMVHEMDCKALETLGTDLDPKAEKFLLSNDKTSQKFGKTQCLHWLEAMKIWF